MHRILFVCHGNICRSPMAECVMADMAEKSGLTSEYWVASAATSTEELGKPIHRGTRRKLEEEGVPLREHRAVQFHKSDYEKYNLILGMDSANIHNLLRLAGGDRDGKVFRLLDFSSSPRDIAVPWYTGDFDTAFRDILEGCQALMKRLSD